jgi:hypothetical protein
MSWLGGASVWWIATIARASASPHILQVVTRVVIGVGVCVFVARPMLTGDVWCYGAFARAAATGVNPYTTPLSDALRSEFRVESCGDTPTYGPLWTFGTARSMRSSRRLAFSLKSPRSRPSW